MDAHGPERRGDLREIVIQYRGEPGTGFGWFEFVFLELSRGGFSIYKRSDETWGTDSAVFVASESGALHWRRVYQFLRRATSARVPRQHQAAIIVNGVELWQSELMIAVLKSPISRVAGAASKRGLKFTPRIR